MTIHLPPWVWMALAGGVAPVVLVLMLLLVKNTVARVMLGLLIFSFFGSAALLFTGVGPRNHLRQSVRAMSAAAAARGDFAEAERLRLAVREDAVAVARSGRLAAKKRIREGRAQARNLIRKMDGHPPPAAPAPPDKTHQKERQQALSTLLFAVAIGALLGVGYMFLDASTRGQFTWPLRIASLAAFGVICAALATLSHSL